METEIKYTLIGYVLFTGNNTEGHYEVICRGDNKRWFLYDDEKTNILNKQISSVFKSEELFLLYAECDYTTNHICLWWEQFKCKDSIINIILRLFSMILLAQS